MLIRFIRALMATAALAGGSVVFATAASATPAPTYSVATISPPPGDASTNLTVFLDSVACPTLTSCVAVGLYATIAPARRLAMSVVENGGLWSVGTTVTPPAAANASNPATSLDGIACPSISVCVAVGDYSDRALASQGWATVRTNGKWAHVVELVMPTDAAKDPDASIGEVSCVSVKRCVAVGSYENRGGQVHPLAVTWNGSSWSRAVALGVPRDFGGAPGSVNSGHGDGKLAQLDAVSCVTATSCTALGTYTTKSGSTGTFVVASTPKGWGAAQGLSTPPGAAHDPQSSVGSIACFAAGCVLDGTFAAASGAGRGYLRTEHGGVWSAPVVAVPPKNGPASTDASLTALSCSAAGSCLAAGAYRTASGPSAAFALTEQGGTWGPASVLPLPNNAGASPSPEIADAKCLGGAGVCTVVGSYQNSAGKVSPFALTT